MPNEKASKVKSLAAKVATSLLLTTAINSQTPNSSQSPAVNVSPDQAITRLWYRGKLNFLFHRGQEILDKTFRDAPGAVVVFNVSRQWGKTFFAGTKAVELALSKPGCKIRYATAFETDLLEFAIPAFERVLDTCPDELRPRYFAHKKKYVFKNGSEIKLIGLDRKPNGLRGNTIDFIILDEAGFINRLDYLHTSVIVPLTTHRPDAKILVISTPPESPDHAFWDFVDRAKFDGAYCEFDIDSNPLLTRADIERIEREMGGRHTTAFQREYLCKRIIEASRAIVGEWKPEYEQEPIIDEFFKFYQKMEGLDIGVQRDFTVDIFGHYDFRRATLFIHDETWMMGPDMTTEKLAGAVKAKEKELWGWTTQPDDDPKVELRVSDNSHPLLNNDLSMLHGLNFVATDKEKLHEMVNLVKIWVKQGRIVVAPRCKQLIGCLRGGIWDEKRKEFDHSKVYGHYDALAALVYLVRNIDESYNPIPAVPFPTFETFIMPGGDENLTHVARTLKNVFRKR
jgi:hypothetical protein